jgi:hypothetical protein
MSNTPVSRIDHAALADFLTEARDACRRTKANREMYDHCIAAMRDASSKPDLPVVAVTEEMVSRFLSWKLPKSVRPDECALDQNYPHRIGTNLLTADEARQMLEHVLLTSSETAAPCQTCNDDPQVCATVPGLRHCEAAQRECSDDKSGSENSAIVALAEDVINGKTGASWAPKHARDLANEVIRLHRSATATTAKPPFDEPTMKRIASLLWSYSGANQELAWQLSHDIESAFTRADRQGEDQCK